METFRSAQLVILDPADRILLFRYHDEHRPPFWSTAGGRLLPGETFRRAAERELAEETGFVAAVGPCVCERTAVCAVAEARPAQWEERHYLVRHTGGDPDRAGWTDEERRTIRAHRWWASAELRAVGDAVLPPWLPDLQDAVRAGRAFVPPA
jgi:ADP-ribose pyrophosphatase YjhB (NUDIX family)